MIMMAMTIEKVTIVKMIMLIRLLRCRYLSKTAELQ